MVVITGVITSKQLSDNKSFLMCAPKEKSKNILACGGTSKVNLKCQYEKKWQIIATSTDNDKALVHIDETPSLIGRPVIYVRIARQLEGAEPLKSEFKQKLN